MIRGQVEQGRDIEGFQMKVPKYFIIFFSLFFLTNVQAMEDDLEAQILSRTDSREIAKGIILEGQIISAIDGRTFQELGKLLQERREGVLTQVVRGGKRSHEKKQEQVSAAFQGAQEAAKRNVEAANNNLGILTNTGRRNQIFGGFAAIGFGLAKGIYDIIQFWDEDTKAGANVFSLINDGSLMVVGAYGLKLAYENGEAKSEYNQAVAIQFLVQQVAQLEDTSKKPKE